MNPSVLYIVTRALAKPEIVLESLDALLVLAAFDWEPSVLLTDGAATQLASVPASEINSRQAMLNDYGIKHIHVVEDALKLAEVDLQQLPFRITSIAAEQVGSFIARHDIVLSDCS